MGSNGAGKSTLLRAAAGLVQPQRGRIDAPRGVALLPQRPADLFVHERVGKELSGEAAEASLRRFGLEGLVDVDPRDLSGGERQRLALAIVVAGRDTAADELPGALLLDEPTRGMDRARKGELAELVRRLATQGTAVMIATHDVEFAATFADRVILLARSEVARILDGAATTVEEGVALLQSGLSDPSGAPSPARGGTA